MLLHFNRDERECPENDLLKNLSKAIDEDDDVEVEYWALECRTLVWSLLKNDYSSHHGTFTEVIKLHAKTVNGVLQLLNHDRHLKYPVTGSIDNMFPDIPTFSARDIIHLEEIDCNIFKVQSRRDVYCMKTVHRTGNDNDFIREVSVLQHCSHPHIIQLLGLVIDEAGKIEAMLTEYVEGAISLRQRESFTSKEIKKWSKQIKEAIDYLHENRLVWGDAKAANVLIKNNGDAVLIDFGGGATRDWVSIENYETPGGDMQGWENIVAFMQNRLSK